MTLNYVIIRCCLFICMEICYWRRGCTSSSKFTCTNKCFFPYRYSNQYY